ncbi:MAG: hypothetical protein ABIR84_05120 [Candidatus Nitrotoga sp.]
MKMPFEPRRLTTILLLALIFLLIWTIGTELGWGKNVKAPLPQPRLQKNRPVLIPLQPEFELLPLVQSYTEILARPLFVSNRRPLPIKRERSPLSGSSRRSTSSSSSPASQPSPPALPTPAEPPKPTMRKGQFILDGIIITKNKNIALLREVATRKMVRVELGEEINGMQIEKLDPDKITFKQGDEREELILKIKTGSTPPGRPGIPSAPAQHNAPTASLPGSPAVDNAADPRSVFERRRALRQLQQEQQQQ